MLLYNSKKNVTSPPPMKLWGLKLDQKLYQQLILVIPAVNFIISRENKSKYEGVPFPPYFLQLRRHCEF